LISFNKIFTKTVSVLFLVILFIVTIFVQEANTGITNDFKRSKLRIDAVDAFLDSHEIKTGDVYYLKNLYNNTSTFVRDAVPSNFWEKYFERKKGVQIKPYENYDTLFDDYSEKDTTVHLIFFEQSGQGNEMILSIVQCLGTKLTSNIEDVKSDIIDVGYYSTNKKIAVSILTDSICNVTINDGLMKSHNTFHQSNIHSRSRKPAFYFSINGKDLQYNTLMIKNMTHENLDFITITE
jgi:hypothetical protein